MKQLLIKVLSSKLVVLGLAIALICCISITVYALFYVFPQLKIGGNSADLTIFQDKFDGTNIRCSFSTSANYDKYIGTPYILRIEKKDGLWTWNKIAEKNCTYGEQVSLAAYYVGDGEYRFVVTPYPHQDDGININGFSATSWN